MKPELTYPASAIRRRRRDTKGPRVRVTVAPGETAWRPDSTKDIITGPAEVLYTFFPDGGIDTIVSTPEAMEAHYAEPAEQ